MEESICREVLSEYQEQINKLKEQNDELAKALGKTTVERDWAVGKLKSLDLSNRKSLVESELKLLPKARQCELLEVNRASVYYKAKPFSTDNLKVLNRIDDIYTENPEFGYRYIHQQLLEDGFAVGKDGVLKYMRMMGIEASYPHKKQLTSVKDNQHQIYSYLLDQYWTKLKS